MLTPEILSWLRSERGLELLSRAEGLRDEPFAVSHLRAEGWPAGAAAAAVDQVRLRRRAASRFPAASRMWFSAALLEQASGAEISRHRARRFPAGELSGDLCCGLGGDTLSLLDRGPVLGMDRDPLALALTRANAEALGRAGGLETRLGSVPADVPALAAAWVDPGRRESGRRTRRLDEISPPLAEILSLRGRVEGLGVKLSPATADEELDGYREAASGEREFLSVRGECLELALWLGALAGGTPGLRRATLLPGGQSLAGLPVPWEEPRPAGRWLLEPDAAVIRAGLVGNLAREVGAWPLDARLAYLSVEAPPRTPFAEGYRIEPVEPFSARALAARLRALGAGDVVLKTRGAAVSPEIMRHRLRGVLKQGRPDCRPVVFLTRLAGRAVMIVGERLGPGD